jgi:hypothetical protein
MQRRSQLWLSNTPTTTLLSAAMNSFIFSEISRLSSGRIERTRQIADSIQKRRIGGQTIYCAPHNALASYLTRA